MTSLIERYTVACPYVRARDFLSQIIGPIAAEGRVEPLTLSAALAFLPRDLHKRVLVRYAAGADPMHFDEPWRVSWQPEGGGPFPAFEGELTVRADEGYDSAVLELKGEYTPPLGAAGRAFDAAIGGHIAASTAQMLLAQIASGMRDRHAAEEAAKRGATERRDD